MFELCRAYMFFKIIESSDPKLLPNRKTSWPFFVTFLAKNNYLILFRIMFSFDKSLKYGENVRILNKVFKEKKRIIFSSISSKMVVMLHVLVTTLDQIFSWFQNTSIFFILQTFFTKYFNHTTKKIREICWFWKLMWD